MSFINHHSKLQTDRESWHPPIDFGIYTATHESGGSTRSYKGSSPGILRYSRYMQKRKSSTRAHPRQSLPEVLLPVWYIAPNSQPSPAGYNMAWEYLLTTIAVHITIKNQHAGHRDSTYNGRANNKKSK
jgi:hypothetical protein